MYRLYVRRCYLGTHGGVCLSLLIVFVAVLEPSTPCPDFHNTASNGNASLAVRSNSPAIVDSVVTFHAFLCIHSANDSFSNDSYTYVWTNDAVNSQDGIIDIDVTVSGVIATISKVFSAKTPGNYSMKVMVFNWQEYGIWDKSPLAVADNNFTLTETLNVLTSFSQLQIISSQDAYVTREPVTATAYLLDAFRNMLWYHLTWFIDGTSYCTSVDKNRCPLLFLSPGNHSVQLAAVVLLNQTTTTEQHVTLVRKKSKVIQHYLLLKNRVSNVTVVLSDDLNINDSYVIHVSCDGSPPFRMQCNISEHVDSVDHTQGNLLTSNSSTYDNSSFCHFRIVHHFVQPGNYVLSVAISNDVSLARTIRSVNVVTSQPVTRGEPRVPAYLPFFSAVIAVGAFVAVLWSFLYRRQSRSTIEEANFEFYRTSSFGSRFRRNRTGTVSQSVLDRAKAILVGVRSSQTVQRLTVAVWPPAPRCDENEMRELSSNVRNYSSNGVTHVHS